MRFTDEGIPSYKSAKDFPDDMFFVSVEAMEMLRSFYDEVEFAGEFKVGDKERYYTWWETIVSGCTILGTKKIAHDHNGDPEYFYLMGENGETILSVMFEIVYRPEKKYLIAVPNCMQRLKEKQIPESFKKLIFYDEHRGVYYLRVRKDEYKELIKKLHDAKKLSEEAQVPLSYFFE